MGENKVELGRYGEDIAGKYLRENNYELIEQNYRCHYGEIDIIAREKEVLIFVEVKTRTSKSYGLAKEAVDKRKQLRLHRCGQYYMLQQKMANIKLRFDVIEVYIMSHHSRKTSINHIINAF